jgi:hypothetical protein
MREEYLVDKKHRPWILRHMFMRLRCFLCAAQGSPGLCDVHPTLPNKLAWDSSGGILLVLAS